MTDGEKKSLSIIAAIIVAIILWLLFAKRDAIKKVLQDAGFTLPQISLPGVPEYEVPEFPSIGNPVNLDGCKMCMNGNYSVILPAAQPKEIPAYVPPAEVAKAIAYPRGYSSATMVVTPAKPRQWWI